MIKPSAMNTIALHANPNYKNTLQVLLMHVTCHHQHTAQTAGCRRHAIQLCYRRYNHDSTIRAIQPTSARTENHGTQNSRSQNPRPITLLNAVSTCCENCCNPTKRDCYHTKKHYNISYLDFRILFDYFARPWLMLRLYNTYNKLSHKKSPEEKKKSPQFARYNSLGDSRLLRKMSCSSSQNRTYTMMPTTTNRPANW